VYSSCSAIEGGETRTIRQGDVVVIPAGTPHWFREVNGPVTYYTVKAR
jgi:quercetin dioxygenase-like cupin family protein